MIITIHQPNFIPWYPFFQKIEQSDVFVLLGHCQYEKSGYQNRFNLENSWHTMSVNSGKHTIKNKTYVNHEKDWNKIKINLKKYATILDELDVHISNDLYQTNSSIIKHLIQKLGIKTKVVEDYHTDLTSSKRLLDICKRFEATTYIAGQGGKNYLDESIFKENGINIVYQEDYLKVHVLDYLCK